MNGTLSKHPNHASYIERVMDLLGGASTVDPLDQAAWVPTLPLYARRNSDGSYRVFLGLNWCVLTEDDVERIAQDQSLSERFFEYLEEISDLGLPQARIDLFVAALCAIAPWFRREDALPVVRIQKDPHTGEPRGLLVEPGLMWLIARRHGMVDPRRFDNTAWQESRLGISLSGAITMGGIGLRSAMYGFWGLAMYGLYIANPALAIPMGGCALALQALVKNQHDVTLACVLWGKTLHSRPAQIPLENSAFSEHAWQRARARVNRIFELIQPGFDANSRRRLLFSPDEDVSIDIEFVRVQGFCFRTRNRARVPIAGRLERDLYALGDQMMADPSSMANAQFLNMAGYLPGMKPANHTPYQRLMMRMMFGLAYGIEQAHLLRGGWHVEILSDDCVRLNIARAKLNTAMEEPLKTSLTRVGW